MNAASRFDECSLNRDSVLDYWRWHENGKQRGSTCQARSVHSCGVFVMLLFSDLSYNQSVYVSKPSGDMFAASLEYPTMYGAYHSVHSQNKHNNDPFFIQCVCMPVYCFVAREKIETVS